MAAGDHTFTCADCGHTWPYDAIGKQPSLKHRACICEHCANPEPQFNHFGGATYDPARDRERLSDQQRAVIEAMLDGGWLTIPEVAEKIGARPESINAVGARIRDIRKIYGTDAMESQRVTGGLWKYRCTIGRAA